MKHRLASLRLGLLLAGSMPLVAATSARAAATLPYSQQVASLEGREYLREGWRLRDASQVTESAEKVASKAFTPTGWLVATVPGTVLTTLVNQGVYPEPLYGLNNLAIPESLATVPYWYRTELKVPAAFRGRRVWLHFDGINHRAEIWLNGKAVGTIAGAFKRTQFDITDQLASGDNNVLAVKILPPPTPGTPHKNTLEAAEPNGGAHAQDAPALIATAGWDWIPTIRDRDMGIWKDVYLRATGPVVLEHPRVKASLPDLPSTERAELTVSTELRNATNSRLAGLLRGRIEDVTFSVPVVLEPGEVRTIALTSDDVSGLSLKHPRLWWPNGYGAQELYIMDLSFETLSQISDQRQIRFGVRDISYETAAPATPGPEEFRFKPADGRYLRIYSDKSTTSFGFGIQELEAYGPEQARTNLALRATAMASSSTGLPPSAVVDGLAESIWNSANQEVEWLTLDLRQARKLDRVVIKWQRGAERGFRLQSSLDGSHWRDLANYEPPELIIKVNGQRIMAKGGNWGMDEAMKRVDYRRFAAQIRFHREAHLTMIRNWVGMTDDDDFYDLCDENGLLIWDDFWLANPGDGPAPTNPALFLDNARDKILRYRNHPSIALWCARNEGFAPENIATDLEAAVRELDGTRRFQPSSADAGVHGHGPYGWRLPESYYSKFARGFTTEIGLPSIPSVESIRAMMPDEALWPQNDTWGYHDYTGGACESAKYSDVMNTRYGMPISVEDFARKGQMLNYETYKAVFEAWNRRLWNGASGVLLWMSNPAQPSFVWQLYDYFLEPTASYFAVKKACEPLHIQLNLDDLSVSVINHQLAAAGRLTATARIFAMDGGEKLSRAATIDVGANQALKALDLTLPEDLGDAYFVKLSLADQAGRVLADNFYWRPTQGQDLTSLSWLPSVHVESRASAVALATDVIIEVELKNPSDTVALETRLKVIRDQSRRRVLPIFADDNFISLLPGEAKTVRLSFARDDLAGERPLVMIEGFNIDQGEVALHY